MKWKEVASQTTRTELRDEIVEHQELLRGHLSESAMLARNYLLLVNAGAAVALMAFMGSNPRIRDSIVSWICLACFAIGVVLVGVLTAIDYQIKVALFKTWIKHTEHFFQNEIELDVLFASLEPLERKIGWAPAVAGYLAFICFIVGSSTAVVRFLHTNGTQRIDGYVVTGHAPFCGLTEKLHSLDCGYFSRKHCESDPINRAPMGLCVPNPD